MLADLSPAEWCEIQAWDQIEPIGHEVKMLGYLASLLASFLDVGNAELRRKAFTPWESGKPTMTSTPKEVEALQARLGL